MDNTEHNTKIDEVCAIVTGVLLVCNALMVIVITVLGVVCIARLLFF